MCKPPTPTKPIIQRELILLTNYKGIARAKIDLWILKIKCTPRSKKMRSYFCIESHICDALSSGNNIWSHIMHPNNICGRLYSHINIYGSYICASKIIIGGICTTQNYFVVYIYGADISGLYYWPLKIFVGGILPASKTFLHGTVQ